MTWLLASVVLIVVLALWAWRRGRDRRVEGVPSARRLRMAALVPLALQVGVFLMFGLGEMASGDWSGAGHLLQVAGAVLLAGLAWLRPLEGGVGLLAAGAVTAASMLGDVARAGLAVASSALLILALPLVVAGALFLWAGLQGRRGA